MKRFTEHTEEWGSFVDVKVNFLERLEKEVKKAKPGVVMISSVTDAYQPIEEKYKLTRGALEILSGYDFSVSIQTKSDLVLRDIDILKRIKDREVGFTITCLDENIQRKFEPASSSTQKRFVAMKKLKEEGIDTFIFFGPILPYFSDKEDSLNSFLQKALEAEVKFVYIDKMNYTPSIWERVKRFLSKNFPELLTYYQSTYSRNGYYAFDLKRRVKKIAEGYPLEVELVF